MKSIGLVAVAFAAVVFSSCSSTSVQTDYDHQVAFDRYSTFAWFQHTESQPHAALNQIVDGRLRRAIADNAISKGFGETTPDKAALLFTYYVSLNQQLRMYTTGWGYGYGHRWGWGYGFWPGWNWGYGGVYAYHEGTIIVDVIDRENMQLVWRGVVTRALGKKSASEEEIRKAIDRVMDEFPPS
jgi:hypothetical protein